MNHDNSEKEQKVNKKAVKEKPVKEKKSGQRRCLSCQKSFPSEGPHHRVCDNCKTLQGWVTGNPSFCSHRPDAANDNG